MTDQWHVFNAEWSYDLRAALYILLWVSGVSVCWPFWCSWVRRKQCYILFNIWYVASLYAVYYRSGVFFSTSPMYMAVSHSLSRDVTYMYIILKHHMTEHLPSVEWFSSPNILRDRLYQQNDGECLKWCCIYAHYLWSRENICAR